MKTHLVLAYPGDFAPIKGEPVEGASDVLYNTELSFRQAPTIDALHGLINGRVSLSVVDSASGATLASVSVDMVPFALGSTGFQLSDVDMEVASSVAPGCLFKVWSAILLN